MIGIRIEPTAAEQPAELVIEVLMKKVASVAPGISSGPALRKGLANDWMRCWSHCVSFITNAKPITEMIASNSLFSCIACENALNGAIGSPATSARKKPAQNSTSRVSYCLTIK